ncbi:hypothetical protein [Marinomonas sp. 2405UD68-3]|uniref:hypothetical protein n=1 Tax=Marinomonas sp. 2405UD68-3 TaxID=3391835 RepID=UPI0039C950A5
MISKKAFLKAYQDVNKLNENTQDHNPIYKSKRDEELIKDYHYAKFQKNAQTIAENSTLKELLQKKEWTEEDIAQFFNQLK